MTEEEKVLQEIAQGVLQMPREEGFFHAGNLDLAIDIMPHNCQSGLWYSATWEDKDGRQRYVGSMYLKLLWERIMKAHIISQRKEEPA